MNMFTFFRSTKKITFDEQLLNSLYRYGLSLCHREDQAYELVQSCCEKILKKPTEHQNLKSYMMRIIRNEYIDLYRRNKLELVIDSELKNIQFVDEQGVLPQLEQIMIDKQHVALIMDQLTSEERELLYLWAVEGLSMQELSLQTNTPRATLLARLNRLKKRLNKQFGHLVNQVS